MNRSALLGLATLIALGTAGCSTSRIASHSRAFNAPQRAPTYALAVTVHGGLQPTPAQWAAIQAKVAHELALRGAVLVTDIALADRVIRVDFRPNPYDPEGSGHLTVLGVRTNPYRGIASLSSSGPFSPAFSYSRAFSPLSGWGSFNYYSGDYFNYVGPWENGYTSGSTTVVSCPTPVNPPPHRPRPSHDRELCPPDALRPAPTYASTPRLAVAEPAAFANNSPATPSSEPRRWTGERSAWRSDSSTARPTRTYARADGSRGTRSFGSSDSGSWRDRSYARADSSHSSSSGSWWSGSRDSSSHSSYSSRSDSGSSSYSSPSFSSRSETMYSGPSSTPSFSSSDSSSSSSSSYSSSSSSSSGATYNSSATEASSSDIAR